MAEYNLFTLNSGYELHNSVQSESPYSVELSSSFPDLTTVAFSASYENAMISTDPVAHDFSYTYEMSFLSGTAAISYEMPYQINRSRSVENSFRLRFKLKNDFTVFEFSTPFIFNRVLVENTYSLQKNHYRLGLLRTKAYNFRSPSKITRIDDGSTSKVFLFKNRQALYRVGDTEFKLKSRYEYANVVSYDLKVPYAIRFTSGSLVSNEAWEKVGDSYNYSFNIDTVNMLSDDYKIIVDNGSRYLKFITMMTVGQSSPTGSVSVQVIPEGGTSIKIQDVDMDASLSVSVVESDLKQLPTKWKSMIPRYEIDKENEETDLTVLDSPVMRVQLLLPDPCCLGKKVSVDSLGNACFIPIQKFRG